MVTGKACSCCVSTSTFLSPLPSPLSSNSNEAWEVVAKVTMGRKKQKKSNRNQPAASSVLFATATGEAAAVGAALNGTSEYYDDNAVCDLTDANSAQPSAQSSWFPEVKWVGRHDCITHGASQGFKAICTPKSSGTSESADADQIVLHSTSSSKSKQPPKEYTHKSLLSELNKIKEQLMPAAEICADAINKCQSTKNTTPEYEFRQARSKCNPYECLGETFSKNHFNRNKKNSGKRKRPRLSGSSQFINRSAIKLANIDALIGFSLTSSKMNQDQNFVFVDLCGAPGGFSEYLLYRHVHPVDEQHTQPDLSNAKNHNRIKEQRECVGAACYGFGMSLSGSNTDGKGVSWRLDHLERYHLHTNNAQESNKSNSNQTLNYHVCNGADNTGSIYNWDNVLQLQSEIISTLPIQEDRKRSYQPLANLVVADGGFDAQRDSNCQESIAHKIIVSQTAAALFILRPGGTFVLKMFGFREESTRSMLQYLYGFFDRMTFIKPILSRPASAERYLVCQGYNSPGAEWDGLTWRDNMMARKKDSCNVKVHTQQYMLLDALMDSFDLDMLQLNIDTCNSIISYLHARKESVEQGDGIAAHNNPQCINIKDYEATWQIF